MPVQFISDPISRLKEGPLNLKESAYAFKMAQEDDGSAVRLREAVGTTDFDSFLSANIETKLKLKLQESPSLMDKLARTEKSSKSEENILSTEALAGTFEEVAEGDEYPKSGYGESTHTVKSAKYGEMIEITEEMIYFDRTHELNRNIEKLADKAARTKDELVLKALLDGENLTDASNGVYTTANGNRGTAALDESALAARIKAFRMREDSAGNIVDVTPNTIVVTPDNELTARKLLNSIELYSSDGSFESRERNVIPQMMDNPQLIVSARLAKLIDSYNSSYKAGSWFMLRAKEALVYYEVWPLEVFSHQKGESSDAAFTRDVFRYKVRFFGGVGVEAAQLLDGNFVSA